MHRIGFSLRTGDVMLLSRLRIKVLLLGFHPEYPVHPVRSRSSMVGRARKGNHFPTIPSQVIHNRALSLASQGRERALSRRSRMETRRKE